MKKVKVPAGLKKCQKCGHYKGFCLSKEDRNTKFRVSCACHDQICKRCGKKTSKFPIGSIYYNPEGESFVSTNYISGIKHISEDCIPSGNKEDRQ